MAPQIAALAQGWAPTLGHFDELRAWATGSGAPEHLVQCAPVWQEFFSQTEGLLAADMDRRFDQLQRQVRENGVSYNVYADQEGPQRPWSLDLFPLIIDAAQWQHIETGVLQPNCLNPFCKTPMALERWWLKVCFPLRWCTGIPAISAACMVR
jgi:hypothetical protein